MKLIATKFILVDTTYEVYKPLMKVFIEMIKLTQFVRHTNL